MFGSKPVTIDGVYYDSIESAARALNMCSVTLSRWLKSGRPVHRRTGSQWNEPLFIDGLTDSSGKPVAFWSVREVAEFLHISWYKAKLVVEGQRAVNKYRKHVAVAVDPASLRSGHEK